MATNAWLRVWLVCCSAVALSACGSADDTAKTVVTRTPSSEAKAKVLTPTELALGRLRKAAAEGDFVMTKALIDQGTPIDGLDPTDPQRNTALHAAVDPGHFPVAKLLFQRGADIAAKNAANETPVDIARKRNHEAIIVLLGMRRADEAVPPETAAAPVDPSKLDPGALIAKVGDILGSAQAKKAQEQVPARANTGEQLQSPSPAPAPAHVIVQAPAEAEAPAKAKPDEDVPPALAQKKEELCGQITSAMAGLTETQALSALEEAGISRDVAMQQLSVARSACQQ